MQEGLVRIEVDRCTQGGRSLGDESSGPRFVQCLMLVWSALCAMFDARLVRALCNV